MKWGQYNDMYYMFLFLADSGDGEVTHDELAEMCTKVVQLRFEKDLDGDGVVDDALTEKESETVIDTVWAKYGNLDIDGRTEQFFDSARGVAEHFAYSHHRLQSFVNDMVDVAAADGYISSMEETTINALANVWGCTANISYQGGVPVILFVW